MNKKDYNNVTRETYDIFSTFKKHEAIENCINDELDSEEEYDVKKDFLDEYYYQPSGLVQFVYDYLRNNGYNSVQYDKEALKNIFADLVEQNYYFIKRR